MHRLICHTNCPVASLRCGNAGTCYHLLFLKPPLRVLGFSCNAHCWFCASLNICCCSHLLYNNVWVKSNLSGHTSVNRRHRPSWWCWSFWGWPRTSSLSRLCHLSDDETSSKRSPKTWTAFSVSWWQFCVFMLRITGKRSVEFYLAFPTNQALHGEQCSALNISFLSFLFLIESLTRAWTAGEQTSLSLRMLARIFWLNLIYKQIDHKKHKITSVMSLFTLVPFF